jgi:hypothetical protein
MCECRLYLDVLYVCSFWIKTHKVRAESKNRLGVKNVNFFKIFTSWWGCLPPENFAEFFKNVYFKMLVPKLNCFSHAFVCKLGHLSHRGTSFYMPSSNKFAAKSFSQYCKSLVSTGHCSDPGAPKFSWGEERSDDNLVKGQDCIESARKFSKRMCVYWRQHQFEPMSCLLWTTDTISPHSLPSAHLDFTLGQSTFKFSLERTFLALKNWITNHTS